MICKQVAISTEYIKLDSFLKFCGAAESGGEAKFFVAQGAVSVDGSVCLQRGRKLYPGSLVEFGDTRYKVITR